MYTETNYHLELIEKDGTVKTPSIFMFKYADEVTAFIRHSKKMNCTIVFENENITISPDNDDYDYRYVLYAYSSIIANREAGNAYCRYLGNLDKMSWDKIGKEQN